MPADLICQLAVAVDVPAAGLDAILDVGGPVFESAVTGLPVPPGAGPVAVGGRVFAHHLGGLPHKQCRLQSRHRRQAVREQLQLSGSTFRRWQQ